MSGEPTGGAGGAGAPTGEALRVLVVDDDFRVAALHEAFVDRVPGFRVVGRANSAAQAYELAQSLHPDLVLMDIYLPDGDGLDVVRRLLGTPDSPAVIVISAANDIATVRHAVQLGAVHYLVKPFSFAALAERLATFRDAQEHFAAWPDEATQDDVNKIFGLLRPPPANDGDKAEPSHLAPTLKVVYDAVAASDGGVSASEVATIVGISRATAQRSLTQLEQSDVVKLELRYGFTGRPEHRYTVKRR